VFLTHHPNTLPFLAFLAAGADSPNSGEHLLTVFFVEIVLMLFVGRLLGEVMQRLGQPAVMGQLIAGVVLGPSILGAFAPSAYQALFPNTPEQKKMLDAIAQVGVLMLLLLTGMETDIALINRVRRKALFSSVAGVLLPFACGFTLGEYLPASMLPNPQQRLATSLFLATTLSISSVKIVAMVIRDVGFMRRNIGQVILASAILDDTIGWIIIAIIGAIASEGTINAAGLSFSVVGTIVFLAFSFTVGRRIVTSIIRWTNDNFTIELPVITAILLLMFVMALFTEYIGVHTVLGAFIAGVLIGQSPILTRHIEEQLRGLIIAFFAPIFFAVAGLSIDLSVLSSVFFIELAVGLILIASFGKVVGCYVGGRLGGLSHREGIALAVGMNARGSTEVIVASIGLSLGVLTRDIYTLIVVMAITTTMIMPPLLRWALSRIPPTGEEKERLEREAAEENDFVPNVERLLIAVDRSEDGKLASVLSGMFIGTRQVAATVLELSEESNPLTPQSSLSISEDKPGEIVKTTAEEVTRSGQESAKGIDAPLAPLIMSGKLSEKDLPQTILDEVKKGYDMIFLGVENALSSTGGEGITFVPALQKIIKEFDGTTAITVSRGKNYALNLQDEALNILVPITGTDYSRLAAEVAMAIGSANKSFVTALHVSPPPNEIDLIRRQPRERINAGRSLIKEIKAIGARTSVKVTARIKVNPNPERAILRQIERGKHNLVVLGVKSRSGDQLFFGHRVSILLEKTPCSMLIISS